MCVLLEAGLAVTPHTLVKQLVSVLEEGLECVGKGVCVCLVLDLENASVFES